MPRITEERRSARRRSFIAAARRCFAAHGLAGSTMEDITGEAGTSVGAIYPYFATKDDLVRAAIAESLDELDQLLDAVAATDAASAFEPFLATLVARLAVLATHPDQPNLFKLAVHGWSHSQVDPDTAELLRRRYQSILDRLTMVAASWQQSSNLDLNVGPPGLARLTAAVLLGSVVLGSLDLPLPALRPAPL